MYFGSFVATTSTIMVILALAYIIYSAINQKKIKYWGRKIALLALFGLVICCFVATRDGYDKSVQSTFDTSVKAGIFTLDSIQSTLCCIGGAIIAFSSLSSIFIKNQKYRKVMFFLLCVAFIFKTLTIEISRCMV